MIVDRKNNIIMRRRCISFDYEKMFHFDIPSMSKAHDDGGEQRGSDVPFVFFVCTW